MARGAILSKPTTVAVAMLSSRAENPTRFRIGRILARGARGRKGERFARDVARARHVSLE